MIGSLSFTRDILSLITILGVIFGNSILYGSQTLSFFIFASSIAIFSIYIFINIEKIIRKPFPPHFSLFIVLIFFIVIFQHIVLANNFIVNELIRVLYLFAGSLIIASIYYAENSVKRLAQLILFSILILNIVTILEFFIQYEGSFQVEVDGVFKSGDLSSLGPSLTSDSILVSLLLLFYIVERDIKNKNIANILYLISILGILLTSSRFGIALSLFLYLIFLLKYRLTFLNIFLSIFVIYIFFVSQAQILKVRFSQPIAGYQSDEKVASQLDEKVASQLDEIEVVRIPINNLEKIIKQDLLFFDEISTTISNEIDEGLTIVLEAMDSQNIIADEETIINLVDRVIRLNHNSLMQIDPSSLKNSISSSLNEQLYNESINVPYNLINIDPEVTPTIINSTSAHNMDNTNLIESDAKIKLAAQQEIKLAAQQEIKLAAQQEIKLAAQQEIKLAAQQLTLEKSLVNAWSNNNNFPYEDYSSSGLSINSAINTTDLGSINTTWLPILGEIYTVSFDLTLNSGLPPRIYVESSESWGEGRVFETKPGIQSYTWKAEASEVMYLNFSVTEDVPTNFSVEDFKLYKGGNLDLFNARVQQEAKLAAQQEKIIDQAIMSPQKRKIMNQVNFRLEEAYRSVIDMHGNPLEEKRMMNLISQSLSQIQNYNLDPNLPEIDGRVVHWLVAIDMFLNSPMKGVGSRDKFSENFYLMQYKYNTRKAVFWTSNGYKKFVTKRYGTNRSPHSTLFGQLAIFGISSIFWSVFPLYYIYCWSKKTRKHILDIELISFGLILFLLVLREIHTHKFFLIVMILLMFIFYENRKKDYSIN